MIWLMALVVVGVGYTLKMSMDTLSYANHAITVPISNSVKDYKNQLNVKFRSAPGPVNALFSNLMSWGGFLKEKYAQRNQDDR